MDPIEKISSLVPKHHDLRLRLTDAIIDLCRQEAFYVEELRIEGTVCIVSDRSSVLIAQITEQIGHQATGTENCENLPLLDKAQASNQNGIEECIVRKVADRKKKVPDISKPTRATTVKVGNGSRGRYQCPFCSKSYRFKHGLKDHINVHTGRRPHVCRFCLTPFAHLGSMCGHVRREHREQLTGTRMSHVTSLLSEPCCPCHTDTHNWAASTPSPGDRLDPSHPKPDALGLCGARPRLDLSSKPIDVDRITAFASDALENLKQELVETDGRDSVMGDKESESILDVRKFLQQFENEKEEGGHQPGEAGEQAGGAGQLLGPPGVGLPSDGSPIGTNAPDLIHVLSLSQAAAGPAAGNRWENNNPLTSVNLMTHQQGSPPSVQATQALPAGLPTALTAGLNGPTLEMLAHMAQLAQTPSTFPAISELSQALTSQQRVTVPRLRMPSPQSLQRSADGKFQCPFCDKTYNFKHTLKDHINKHMGNRPHVCKHCGDSFTHLASLCAHIKRRHDSQMTSDYQCELCREKFMNLQSLKQHFTWRHKDVKFSPQKFLESARGVILEPDSPPAVSAVYPANIAPSTSKTNPGDSSQESMPATSCSPQSQQGAAVPPLASPVNASHSPNLQSVAGGREADECLFPPDAIGLSSDDRLPKKPRDAESPVSPSNQPQFPGDFVYPNATACNENIRNPTDGATTPLRQQPDEDTLSFTTHIADYFTEVNLQTEQGLYKYKCKLCGNLFKIRNSLYEHLNSHLGKKPYVCGVCRDAFTHHSSLHNHTRNKHSLQSRQEREAAFRHICGACAKKFRFPSELDRHFKTNPDHDIRPAPPISYSVRPVF